MGYFSETQYFRQWYVFVFLLILNLAFGLGTLQTFGYFNEWRSDGFSPISSPYYNNVEEMDDWMVQALTVVMFLLSIVVLTTFLKTEVKKDGLYVQYFPYAFSPHCYAWKDIEKAYIRTYQPNKRQRGIYNNTENGRVMDVSGDTGLQLEFFDGRRILIGTRKPEELKKALQRLDVWKE